MGDFRSQDDCAVLCRFAPGPSLRGSRRGGTGRRSGGRPGHPRTSAGRGARQRGVRGRASQNEFLAGLVASREIDWSRVVGFHMDEYLGLRSDHPASFRRYLQEHLFRLVGLDQSQVRLIPGERCDRPLQTCLDYEDKLLAEPTDIVCAGIGENGHLAFNDPPVADFLDPVKVKVVRLGQTCRAQQLHDACFDRIEDVPTHAFTLTIPALLAAPHVSVVVPGPRKANAVLTTLRGPVSEACPATALRRHPGATLYLDRDAARLVL